MKQNISSIIMFVVWWIGLIFMALAKYFYVVKGTWVVGYLLSGFIIMIIINIEEKMKTKERKK